MKSNLTKLLSTPGTTPVQVENELNKIFSQVFTRHRNEIFFDQQFICADDDNNVKLVIRYGWHPEKGWMYERM